MSRRTRSRLTFVRLYPFYGMSVRLFLPPMIVRGSRSIHAGVSRDLVRKAATKAPDTAQHDARL
jgi:hypothetical protein